MDFVFVGGIVLLVLLGPWVLVWRISSRRKRERDEDNERWQELSSRTYTLEQTVRTLQARRPGSAAEEATPKTLPSSTPRMGRVAHSRRSTESRPRFHAKSGRQCSRLQGRERFLFLLPCKLSGTYRGVMGMRSISKRIAWLSLLLTGGLVSIFPKPFSMTRFASASAPIPWRQVESS